MKQLGQPSPISMESYLKMSRFQLLTTLFHLAFYFSDLSVALSSPLTDFQHAVYIDSVNGSDSKDCLECNSPSLPCQSLPWALNTSARASHTIYILTSGTHYLDASIEPFELMDNIEFVGNGGTYHHTVINCTAPEHGGLSFKHSTNIHISNLSFIGCSNEIELHQPSAWFGSHAALFFDDCINVALTSVRVAQTPSATGVVMLNTTGNVNIKDSLFDENGWRGIHIQLSSMNESHINISVTYVTIHNTTFTKNAFNNHDRYLNKTSQSCILFRRSNSSHIFGGGMSVVIQSVSKVAINISNSNLTYNKAVCGAGLFVAFEYQAINNSIHLYHTTFENNHGYGNYTLSFGGGIRLEHLLVSMIEASSTAIANKVYIDKCNIHNNHAFVGGGLSIHPIAQEKESTNVLFELEIVDSNFEGNQADVGAAIEITLFLLGTGGRLPIVTISDSKFVSNKVTFHTKKKHTSSPYQIGIGAVYTNKVPIAFRKSILFEGNKGTSVAVAGTYVDFGQCTATFHSNKGISGAGLALLGAAGITIDENTTMNFTRNHASLYGGALYNFYIEKENLVAYSNCFIRHKESFKHPWNWTAKFYFTDNSAEVSGQSIYSTSISPCALDNEFNSNNLKSNTICLDNWLYYQNGAETNCSTEIGTEAGNITSQEKSIIHTSPGEVFSLNLDIFDDLGNNVSQQTVFTAHTSSSSNTSIDSRYRYTSNGKLAVNGEIGTQLKVHLSTTGERTWHVYLDVELSDCPPGFSLSKSNSTSTSYCKCSETGGRFKGTVKCNQARLQSYLLNGHWLGKLENSSNSSRDGEYFVSLCPPEYCNKDKGTHLLIPRDNLTLLNEIICVNEERNRTGTMCGKCIDNHGPAVNSDNFQCVKCERKSIAGNVIQYIFSVYLPLFILFSCIVIFNVRLTTGPANAFIFFSQIVSSNFNLKADGNIPWSRFTNSSETLTRAYQAPYGLFNLEFIENFLSPFCLGSQLNALDILQLDYVVATSPLVMIIIVLICFKLRRCCQTCLKVAPKQVTTTTKTLLVRIRSGQSLLHVFAAFILLSYTKFGLTSAYILNVTPVFNASGAYVGNQRAYFAGQYSLSDGEYVLRYCVPAYIVFIGITIPPLFLFGYPVIWFEKCLIRIPCLWKLYPADKVQILLDTFQGCYRDKMRFFAGMYFFFRLVINLSYIFTQNWTQRFMVQQIVCIVFIIIIALCRPYRDERWILNYVDLLIFANLGIINALSFYLYAYSQSHHEQDVPSRAFILQYILVFVPLLYMIVYVMWKLIKRFLNNCKKGIFSKRFTRKLTHTQSYSVLDEQGQDNEVNVQESIGSTLSRPRVATYSEVRINESVEYRDARSDDEILFVRARAQNTYKATSNSSGKLNNKSKTTQATRIVRRDITPYQRDSGLHTCGESCTDSTHNSQLLTSLVNDDNGCPVHGDNNNYGSIQ